MPTFTCLNCPNTAQHVCACCKKSLYCGKDCQDSDWKMKHKYESFLFKAESPSLGKEEEEEDLDREREKRQRIEKMKTESDLLREEYQEVNRKLEEARKKKRISKKEMAMTHSDRKRFEFNVMLFLKEMGLKDANVKDMEYVKEIENMVDVMNDVPLRSGESRDIVIGPEERVQMGHIIMRKRILNLKTALIMATDSEEVSRDATEYRIMSEDLERRFIFNLLNDDSDEISFDDMMKEKHEEIENELVSNWIEKAYEESIAGASKKCIEFFDSIKEDPSGAKVYVSGEEHQKELEFVGQQLKTLRNCALQYALASTDNQYNHGLITKEVHHNAASYYKKISDRVDSLIDENETITEDMERVMRRYYGKEEWSKIQSLLRGFYMSEEKNEEMVLGVKIFGFTVNKKYFEGVTWAMFIVFFASYFILSFIGIISYNASPVAQVDAIENEINDLKTSLLTKQATLRNDTELLISASREFDILSNRTVAINTTEYFDTARIPTKDLTLTNQDILRMCTTHLLEATNKQISEALERIATEPLLKKTLNDLEAYRTLIEDYLKTDPQNYEERYRLINLIAYDAWAALGKLTNAGFAQTNQVIQLLFDQLKDITKIANSQISNINATLTVISQKSDIITGHLQKLQAMRPQLRGSSMVAYLTNQWNPHGYTTTDKIVGLYQKNSTLDQIRFVANEAVSGHMNTVAYIGILIQDCYESLPLFDSVNVLTSLTAIITAFVTGFLPAQHLFFTLLTVTGTKVGAFAANKLFQIAENWTGGVGRKALKYILGFSKRCCRGSSEDGLEELPVERQEELIRIIREFDKISQSSYENKFYTFFSLMTEKNLTTEEIALLWNRRTNTRGLDNRDMLLFRWGYTIKWLYYLGVQNVADILRIGVVLYRYILTVKFVIDIFQTIVDFSRGSVFLQYFVDFAWYYSLLFAGRMVFWNVSTMGNNFYPDSLDDTSTSKEREIIWVSFERDIYYYARDSKMTEKVSNIYNYVRNSRIGKKTSGVVRYYATGASNFIGNFATKILGFVYTGYRSYFSFISTMMYFFFLFAAFSQVIPNMIPNLDSVRNLFLGWGELPEKIKNVTDWNNDFLDNITSFKKLITGTDAIKNSLSEYVNKGIINGTEIVITDFIPQLAAHNKSLSNLVTTLPK